MIPAFLVTRFGPGLAKLIFWAVVAVLVVAVLGVAKCSYDQTAKARVKLSTNQTGAARESGDDAVNTVGNTISNETAIDQVGRENANAIDHAKGSDTAIDPAARAAGLQSLCRRASYRAAHVECVQQPAPR